ncbi:hypothetical protein OR60_17720 [Xanthomonas vesicatoria]|uniref:Uncharacterized protein n=2 Tax=Xanthomonas vesicatoria TaxID=56460 RepID=A0AAJ0J205_9XANT|nr:hypothetical protein XVE_1925 [Xanthomonas vesicatoria ATCC 35937]KHM92070.1 hypothetical protein OR60_17720 [Xanthomonas vesicatoria]KHM98411.1 hypothetical protein OR61_01265 [Xanthomonas vesicatoria]KTF34221.1 hypothetical protein LMG920_06945 [Xanthomonas vesicatoria]KTF39062.1 hypothetical protein LMG919_00510 [Xanthomonas vesicatoria]
MEIFGVQTGVGIVVTGEQGAQSVHHSGLARVVGPYKDVQATLEVQFGLFELPEIDNFELCQIHRFPLAPVVYEGFP